MEPKILILLAEDEPLVGLTMQSSLEDGGYGVLHVESGNAAIAAIDRQAGALSGLITDIRLGAGPDGWDVARHARETTPTLPVVYMSGDSAHEHSARGVPDSVMLQKPFAPAQLLTAISTLLNAIPHHSSD
ncbi:MAG TPA: response regulator [Allosphingosinicella sp.]